jgi:shikimate dehydrogenase
MMSQAIAGSSRCVGLLGHPVAHSLSPVIHNHVYATLGLPFVYIPLRVEPGHIHEAMAGLRAMNFFGANVTIPHKQAVVPYCDILSPLSQLTGTVNTLYFKDNLLYGTTTDYLGLCKALQVHHQHVKNAHVIILGNGGTARTFGFAMAQEKSPQSLTLIGRDIKKISALAQEITLKTNFPVQSDLFGSVSLRERFDRCTLLINCTSVGMHPKTQETPLPASLLHKDMFVFDAIYNPGTTLLCKQAQKAGCACDNGLRMLVYQGLASAALLLLRQLNMRNFPKLHMQPLDV